VAAVPETRVDAPVSGAELQACRAIHLLTASGIVVGMLAIVAVLDGSPQAAVLLLVLAQVIDGVDGPLARRYRVRVVIPKYDGSLLDLVIDYVTCVLVPAVFAWQFGVLPGGALGHVSIAVLLMSAAMWFSRTDMMTDDHWFRGFPGAWNLVVPTLWLLEAPPTLAAAVVLVLSALSMSDVEFAHPVRSPQWRRQNLGFMAVWVMALTVLTLVWPRRSVLTDAALLLGPTWVAIATAMRWRSRAVERRVAVPTTP
jgi:phosphatidylcholine synthase